MNLDKHIALRMQTGRTTRLLAEAIRLASDGLEVHVVAEHAIQLRKEIRQAHPDLRIQIDTHVPGNFNWKLMRPHGPLRNDVWLIDHYVIESDPEFQQMVTQLRRFDQPVTPTGRVIPRWPAGLGALPAHLRNRAPKMRAPAPKLAAEQLTAGAGPAVKFHGRWPQDIRAPHPGQIRVSTESDDPGYSNLVGRVQLVEVYLDGVKQKYAITADPDLGYVKRYKAKVDGNMALDPEAPDCFATEDSYGKVEIIWLAVSTI